MRNMDIREAIVKANLKYWQVANKYGISDVMFSKKLRYEMSDTEKQKILDVIKTLESEG